MPLVIATPFIAPPPAGCVTVLSPGFWTPNGMSWNGSAWVLPGVGSSRLDVLGPWGNGFRPTSVDITYTMPSGPNSDFHNYNVRDTTGASLGSGSGSGNGVGTHTIAISLTFGANDMADIDVDSFSYNSTTIDDICFYGVAAPAPTP